MYENEITKLFNLAGIDLNAMVSNGLDELIKNIKEQHPDFPESDETLFRETIRKNMDIENLHNQYVAMYKRYFTQEEITGLIKFWESPLGSKSRKVNQQIIQESRSNAEAYFESLGYEVAKELFEENS